MIRNQLSIFVITVIIVCSTVRCNDHVETCIDLSELLGLIESRDSSVITLSEITDFDWDNVVIVQPYTFIDRLENETGQSFDFLKETGIEQRDDINVLCFYKERRLVCYVVQPRFPIDFVQSNDSVFIKKEKAKFNVKKEGGRYNVQLL